MARRRGGAGARALRKFVLAAAWQAVCAGPSLVLFALGISLIGGRGDQNSESLVFLWILLTIATAPVAWKMIGAVSEVKALPEDARRLEHLSPSCARLAREAGTIRAHLDTNGFNAALQQAWELANEVEQAGPAVRAELERAGASLQEVREIVAGRAADPRGDAKLQRAGLLAALEQFEHALSSPRGRGFR
ncbi:hypothetical protein OV203_16320 [Nannocystis sp. ILAH1]|uniref:hypothetical protein n=1 Tax=unclassified Nannocystis TaxID=2627009 RepID=UPI00227219CF|nr:MULTISPECIES: hypothetical protein [unclassified Nannocystis]MCY0988701.1 hypothetical protein [Nannocystis sp. ILAH1]MCY1072478.1 hypothetical protein [Nannocystis sp. RBIL2]